MAQTLAAHSLYWEQNLPLRAVAQALGISRQRLHQRFRAAGLPTRGRAQAARRPGSERTIRLLLVRGDLVAKELGGGRWVAALAPAGIRSVTEQRRAVVAERRARVRELWVQGVSASEIARKLDYRVDVVYGDLASIRAGRDRPLPRGSHGARSD